MARSFRNRFVVLAAALGLTLLAGLVFANAVPVPISIGAHSSIPTGLQSTVTFDARGAAGAANAGYYSRPVLVSNNTLGGLAKGMVRRAAPVAAMTAAIAAAGWAIDELTGQVMDGEPQPVPGPVPAGGVYYEYHSKYYSSAAAATAAVIARMDYAGAPHTSHRYSGGDFANLKAVCQHHEAWAAGDHLSYEYFAEHRNETAFPQPFPWADAVPQPQPVPDAALGQLVKDNPALWDQALRNPDGSVNRNPDVQAAAQALANELASGAPAPDPTAEWDTGNQGGNPAPSPTALEFPTFCAWASLICDLADWLQDDAAPPDDDDQVEEIPLVLDQSWSSGFGGGTCPAPVQISVLNTDVAFSYQPLCDVAVYIKPIVLAGTALLCVFIIAGFRRAT